MKHFTTTLVVALAASTAWAQTPPPATETAPAPTPPATGTTAPADGTTPSTTGTTAPADGAPTPVDATPPPVDGTTTPPVTPPPVAPAPVVPPPAVAVAPPASPAAKPFVDDYYDRKRGVGMFHQARLALGVMNGTAPNIGDEMMPVTPGETKGVTQGELAFEGVFLQLPSAYGHFHGIEFSTGLRSTPIDFWLQFGTAVSLFNIGRGGPGSLRVGGSFGAGFNLAHGYGYVRGRAAFVILPARLDAELSASWTPNSASTSNYDELLYRASVWYRPGGPGGSKRAYEVYVESFRRSDDAEDKEREFTGIGGGIGMTFF
jgi:hypothetical protein